MIEFIENADSEDLQRLSFCIYEKFKLSLNTCCVMSCVEMGQQMVLLCIDVPVYICSRHMQLV